MSVRKQRPGRNSAEFDVDRHVGARVKVRRQMIGITQEKLAHACGITFQQVQKYEEGANRIAASRLDQIARALSCTPAFFFDGLAYPGAGVEADPMTSTKSLNLVRQFLRMDEEPQEVVEALIGLLSRRPSAA